FDAILAELRKARDEQLAQLSQDTNGAAMGAPPSALAQARSWAREGAHQRAIEAILDWVGEQPALAARAGERVVVLEAIGDRDAATELATHAVEEDPRSVTWRLELARLYFAAGRAGRAEQEVDEAIYVASDRPGAMRRAAEILEKSGRRRQACAMLSRA